ncbi:MAG: hypothetical protein DCC68_11435 [Planctomycetota bacterium]|nr:MAG: hypothetical protein DCC68_11435 [Planctomycetota bacterium]
MPVELLPQLEEPFELDKPSRALQKRLNTMIAEFNVKLRRYDEAVAAATQSDDPGAIGSLADAVDNLVREKGDLLVEERRIRLVMKEYFAVRNQAHGKACDAQRATLEEVTKRLKDGLLALGYVDGMIPGTNVISIIPDLYFRHPEHKAAKTTLDAIAGAFRSPYEVPNAERLEYIDGEIRAERERLLRSARR